MVVPDRFHCILIKVKLRSNDLRLDADGIIAPEPYYMYVTMETEQYEVTINVLDIWGGGFTNYIHLRQGLALTSGFAMLEF